MLLGIGFLRLLIWIAEIFIGFGLIINCARGLVSREWMYDADSTCYMTWTQLLGIGLGLFLLAHAFGFIHLPLPIVGYGWFGGPGVGGGCPPSGW